jgi:hypothetical protein
MSPDTGPPADSILGPEVSTVLGGSPLWTYPDIVDIERPTFEAVSNASGVTPPRWRVADC